MSKATKYFLAHPNPSSLYEDFAKANPKDFHNYLEDQLDGHDCKAEDGCSCSPSE